MSYLCRRMLRQWPFRRGIKGPFQIPNHNGRSHLVCAMWQLLCLLGALFRWWLRNLTVCPRFSVFVTLTGFAVGCGGRVGLWTSGVANQLLWFQTGPWNRHTFLVGILLIISRYNCFHVNFIKNESCIGLEAKRYDCVHWAAYQIFCSRSIVMNALL